MRISPKQIGLLLGCVIGLPLLTFVMLVWGPMRPIGMGNQHRPVTAKIQFIGYTNHASWGQVAQMRVLNKSKFPIALSGWTDVLETQSSTGWKESPISFPLLGNVILPGQSEVIEFATPTLTNTWRIKVGYNEYQAGLVRTFKAVLYEFGLGTGDTVWMQESEVVTP